MGLRAPSFAKSLDAGLGLHNQQNFADVAIFLHIAMCCRCLGQRKAAVDNGLYRTVFE